MKMKITYLTLLLGIIISLSAMHYYRPAHIVTFDLKGTLQKYQVALAEKKVSPKEQVNRIAIFSDVISKVTRDYGVNHNVVILVSGAVISSSNDKTIEIQQAIFNELQQISKGDTQ